MSWLLNKKIDPKEASQVPNAVQFLWSGPSMPNADDITVVILSSLMGGGCGIHNAVVSTVTDQCTFDYHRITEPGGGYSYLIVQLCRFKEKQRSSGTLTLTIHPDDSNRWPKNDLYLRAVQAAHDQYAGAFRQAEVMHRPRHVGEFSISLPSSSQYDASGGREIYGDS